MPKIVIDNASFEVKAGKNLLEACLALGFDLPYFCWHPALGSVGACRQCAIKSFKDDQDKRGRIVMSCMEEAKDGMLISIADPAAKAFREQVIEWMMTNHPHDCPVCDEGGSCHLQDMTVMTGHDYRRFRYKKRTYKNQYLGPFIHHEMNRCIQCYRCVRYYRDYAGGHDLNVFSAHDHVYFGRETDGVLESPFSGNLVEVCPTGVFTDETLRHHYTRKWDLTMAPSVCQHCGVGCNTIAGERYGKLRNIINRYNGHVNGYFLCDRGRFGYEFVNHINRITQPVIRNRTVEAVSDAELLDHLRPIIQSGKAIGIGSPRASLETNFALMQLVGKENFYSPLNDREQKISKLIVDILASGKVETPSMNQVSQSDAVIILGEDIWNTAPVLALNVRQGVMKMAANDAMQHIHVPQWHDAAIREVMQDSRGYLADIGVAHSPLNEIATHTLRAAPDNIAKFGLYLAHLIDSSFPEIDIDDEMKKQAENVASILQKAKYPVIIAGASYANEALIKAAYNLASVLNKAERKSGLCYVLPDCNSMGFAMMNAPSLEKSVANFSKEDQLTAIVVEADLYRHLSCSVADQFFSKCNHVVGIDHLHNETTEQADILIPASTFAEGDGTIVNNEGRAQRFYQVFVPANSHIRESWKWLADFRSFLSSSNGVEKHPDQLLPKLEKTFPLFDGISKSIPPDDFRVHDQRIPREPHRYSGRTAILAAISVSEPRPPQDHDSALSYTMEGYKGLPPAPMIPFYWSPGWNSGQSVIKYQQEPGGALKGGDPGWRLFNANSNKSGSFNFNIPEAFNSQNGKWMLLPQYHVFGSEELSSYSPDIQKLAPEPYVALSKNDAIKLEVEETEMVYLTVGNDEYALPFVVKQDLVDGIALVPAGLPQMKAMPWGTWVSLRQTDPVL
jgi:NADH-quinone oxidoreductase subunit G